MSTITLKELKNSKHHWQLRIESLEGSHYIALAQVIEAEPDDSVEHYLPIVDSTGKWLKTHNLADMKKQLAQLPWHAVYLIQHSAYDEMIGNPSTAEGPMELNLEWSNIDWVGDPCL